jgi:hypothetical protein
MNGSCLCGGVRYRFDGDIAGINCCHCVQCRKASGTAFATNGAVASDSLVVSAGRELLKSFESSPGKKRWFCGNCGSPIYSRYDSRPQVLYVRIGTLDDDPGRRPDVHIHTGSKAPWYDILDDVPQRVGEEDLWF